MTDIRYRRFGDFHPFYLTEQANRLYRRMHFREKPAGDRVMCEDMPPGHISF